VTVSLEITFPFGRYHATQWGREPADGVVDWPPAPWRILRALYSSWKTTSEAVSDHDGHELFSLLMSVPPTFHVPDSRAGHRRHYYPPPDHRSSGKLSSTASTNLTHDPFVVIEQRNNRSCPIYVEWPIELPERLNRALTDIVGGLGYLGRAESICECSVIHGSRDTFPAGYRRITPSRVNGESQPLIELLSATSDSLVTDLEAVPQRLRAKQRRIIPPGAKWTPYFTVEPADPGAKSRPVTKIDYDALTGITAIRFAIASRAFPPLTQALTVGELSRSAINHHYNALSKRNPDASLAKISQVLTGRNQDGRRTANNHAHAHFFPLSSHASNRVDTLIVYAHGELDVGALTAANALRKVYAPAHVKSLSSELRVAIEAIGTIELAAPELVGPASVWRTRTPFVPVRRQKKMEWMEFVVDSVQRELAGRPWLAEYAAGVGVRIVDDEDDPRRFRRSRNTGPAEVRSNRRGAMLELRFPHEVSGPIALGRHSHIGLGLFQPHYP